MITGDILAWSDDGAPMVPRLSLRMIMSSNFNRRFAIPTSAGRALARVAYVAANAPNWVNVVAVMPL